MSNFPLDSVELSAFLDVALAEDVGAGDITALATVSKTSTLKAEGRAREPLVIAGMPAAEAVFLRLDPGCIFLPVLTDGEFTNPGETLFRVNGNARAILTAERTALNILQHLSGIATLTRSYVDAIEGTSAKVLDTRKTIPGLRKLEKYAILMGGGVNHRMGLFDAILIKDNHIAIAGSVEAAVRAAKRAGHEQIQVECDTLEQMQTALASGAASLLLDNMSLDELREAVGQNERGVPLEASGGVTLETIRGIAETGVDFISVGRLTQSAPAVDIGLDYSGD